MKNMLNVLRFEYKGFVKTKVFRNVTIIFVVCIIAATSIPQLIGVFRSSGAGDGEGGGLFGNNNKAAIILSDAALTNDVYKNAFTADALAGTGAAAWVDLSKDPPDSETLAGEIRAGEYLFAIRYSGGTEFEFYAAGNRMASFAALPSITNYITELARKAEIAALPANEQETVTQISTLTAEPRIIDIGGNAENNFIIGYVLIMFLFYVIMGYSNYVATAVVAEKTSKAMELLITATKPLNLMVGKVVGVGLAALTQVGAIVAAFAAGVAINMPYWTKTDNSILDILQGGNIDASIAFIVIIYFLLGFFLYAFLVASLSSTVSRPEEASTVITLPMILIIVSLLIGFMTLSGGMNKTFIAVLSYIPFFTPTSMISRYVIGDAGAAQLMIGAGIMLVAIVLVAILAAKIFRVGVMLYGVKATPKQLFRAIKNS